MEIRILFSEIIRFKWQLSRLMADLIMEKLYGEPFLSWGTSNLVNVTDKRKEYIAALKMTGHFTPFLGGQLHRFFQRTKKWSVEVFNYFISIDVFF